MSPLDAVVAEILSLFSLSHPSVLSPHTGVSSRVCLNDVIVNAAEFTYATKLCVVSTVRECPITTCAVFLRIFTTPAACHVHGGCLSSVESNVTLAYIRIFLSPPFF